MQTYLDRNSARDYLRQRGVPIGNNALKDHAHRATGPVYKVINGRALYTRRWLNAWIDDQASRQIIKRRPRNTVR